MFYLGKLTGIGGIGQDDLLRHCQIHSGGDNLIDIPHRLCRQSFRLLSRFDSIHSAFGQKFAVKLLQIHGGQLLQWDVADARLDVVVDVAFVGLMTGGSDLDLCHIFKPGIHPSSHGVLSGFGEVNLSSFDQGSCQFFFDLCLGFAKDILENLLAGDRVMTCGVSTFPAAVFSFANVAFAVCSFLCHN